MKRSRDERGITRLGRNYVERADGTREQFGGTHEIDMRAGEVFVIERYPAAATAYYDGQRKGRIVLQRLRYS